jgi:hypothetical protein
VYALTASVTDDTGRVFSDTAHITVYPVGSAGFYLPEIFHTDSTVMVEAVFGEIGSHTANWTLLRDGKEVSLTDAVEGTLGNSGGELKFHAKGSYVLKAEFTDDGGRTYRYEQSFKVYPVPAVRYSLPEYVHTETVSQSKSKPPIWTASPLNGWWTTPSGFRTGRPMWTEHSQTAAGPSASNGPVSMSWQPESPMKPAVYFCTKAMTNARFCLC